VAAWAARRGESHGGGRCEGVVLEREPEFRDRVRGENLVPWGNAEATRLGLGENFERQRRIGRAGVWASDRIAI
jgi:hypothetical protein